MDSLDGFVAYDGLVREILQDRNITVDEVSWRAVHVNWDQYKVVVIRSPWDYQQAPDEFMSTLSTIESSTAVLLNPLEVVRWNVQKTYLRQLQDAGVAIVPTQWLTSPKASELMNLFPRENTSEIVVKPIVGANADDAFRLKTGDTSESYQHVENVFQNRTALVQPFVDSVTAYGEVSLIFFEGQYSHSVLKKPKTGDFRVQEEHGGRIESITPDQDLINFATRALSVVPCSTLYARIDVVFLDNNQPAIMELELIEPSLYLSYDSAAPGRFADVIEARLRELS